MEGYLASANAAQLATVKLSRASSKILILLMSAVEGRIPHFGNGKTAKYAVTMKRHQFAKAMARTVEPENMNGVAASVRDAPNDAEAATFKR